MTERCLSSMYFFWTCILRVHICIFVRMLLKIAKVGLKEENCNVHTCQMLNQHSLDLLHICILHIFAQVWSQMKFYYMYLPSSLHFQKCCVYLLHKYCLYFSDHHQTVQLIKDKRSNSCFSESSEPGSLKNGAEQGRRPHF